MSGPTRASRADALARWADEVAAEDLVEVDTAALKHLGELVTQRDALERDVRAAVEAARRSNRSWSEIGAMLGVSKQAAQRKYSTRTSAA